MDKIICLGKNYLEHAKELGDAIPDQPVIFIKPRSVLRAASQDEQLHLSFPQNMGSVHYEAEIVLRLDKGGYKLEPKEAERLIGAVTVGLDFTLRDLQTQQKKQGHPWTTSKVFTDSAVIGPWKRVSEFTEDYVQEKFSFYLEDKLVQFGFAKDMLLKPAECVAYVSQFFPLSAGDLIFTGTPAGVGPMQIGQKGTIQFDSICYSVLWKSDI